MFVGGCGFPSCKKGLEHDQDQFFVSFVVKNIC